MGTWRDDAWTSSVVSGLPARDRRSGAYRWYLPTSLASLSLRLPQDLALQIASAERGVRALNTADGSALSRVKVQHLFTAFDALRVPSLERAQCNVSSAWTTRAAGCTTPPRT